MQGGKPGLRGARWSAPFPWGACHLLTGQGNVNVRVPKTPVGRQGFLAWASNVRGILDLLSSEEMPSAVVRNVPRVVIGPRGYPSCRPET